MVDTGVNTYAFLNSGIAINIYGFGPRRVEVKPADDLLVLLQVHETKRMTAVEFVLSGTINARSSMRDGTIRLGRWLLYACRHTC